MNVCKNVILLISWFVLTYPVEAQFRVPDGEQEPHTALNPLVASYALTSIPIVPRDTIPMRFASDKTSTSSGHKSVFLAAMLSAAVPGLGEYYVGDDMWRGLFFTGLEVGFWIEMDRWNQRGADTNAAFDSYSTVHFSTTKYANNLDSVLESLHVSDSCNCYASGNNIASINRAEETLDSLFISNPNGDYYGHQLINPSSDAQQYFKMISKYVQYIPGWDNVSSWSEASLLRAVSDYDYSVGEIFLFGIFLNHALSAIDAALLAKDHNSALRVHGEIMQYQLPNGTLGIVPTAKIEYHF